MTLTATNRSRQAGPDLCRFLDEEVRPRLTAEALFTHTSHQWQKSGDKWRGGCPWHDSKSGTAFTVDAPSLQWWCGGCCVGGGPVLYLHCLRTGALSRESPRGADFVAAARGLAELAGVPFPERELTAREREQARLREVRRAILEDVYRRCAVLLTHASAAEARAWLSRRGFGPEAVAELQLGLYPAATDLGAHLVELGYAREDIGAVGVLMPKMAGFVVWPWRDDRGQPLTLYGKWPGGTPPEGLPKTLALGNPKGEGGQDQERTKRSPLYLDRALRAGHRELKLVEGVTDAALPQVLGDKSVIACVAAQLSALQVETLRRRGVESVTIALDPDQAGDSGIDSCLRQLQAADIRAYVAERFPDGMDPDEFILARGLDAWREHTAWRCHPYRWHARRLLTAAGDRQPGDDGWADGIVEASLAFAADLPAGNDDELARHFWPEVAKATGADPADLRGRVAEARRRQTHQHNGHAGVPGRSQAAGEGDGELLMASLASLRPRPIRWLVPRYIPLGKVVLVAGDGGQGKSTFALHLAARLSRGSPALGLDAAGELSGDTLLVQCEDDWEDTVLPRLLALGADTSRIHKQEGVRGSDGKLLPFCLAHYRALENTLEKRPDIKLVVIDPAGAYIGPGVDDHRDSELRALLGPLAELAARRGVTILLVKHFSKAPTAKAVSKISGSTGYVNSVRAAFVVLPDDEPDRALFLPVKFNIGRRPKGRAFRRVSLSAEAVDTILQPFDELTADDRRRIGETVFSLSWEGEVDVTADGQLAEAMRAERGPKKSERCADWLRVFLQEYAYPSDEILAAAKEAGFTFDNVKEAKAALKADGLRSTNRGSYQGTWWCGFGTPDQWRRRPPGAPHSPHSPHNGGTPGENHRAAPSVGSVGSVGSAEGDDPETIKGPWVAPDADPACLETPFD
jgi:hypothetical protein